MADPVDAFLDRLFLREGGESHHPADHGGRTCWGLSEASFPELWQAGPPSQAQARQVYTTAFYRLPTIDCLPDPLRESVFDFAVNAGPATAIRLLQQVVGAAPDGMLGPQTFSLVAAYPATTLYGHPLPGPVALALAYDTARAAFYARLVAKDPSQLPFLAGWQRRAAALRRV